MSDTEGVDALVAKNTGRNARRIAVVAHQHDGVLLQRCNRGGREGLFELQPLRLENMGVIGGAGRGRGQRAQRKVGRAREMLFAVVGRGAKIEERCFFPQRWC